MLVPMGVIWHAWCLHFGVLGTLWRAWDDPGALGSTRKDTLKSRLRFYRSFADLENPFWEFFGFLRTKRNSSFIVVSSSLFLMIFRSESGGLGLESRHLATEVLQKSTFAEIGFLMISGPFFMIWGGLGTKFHDFCCPGDWLEIWWLLRVILGSPQILRTSGLRVIVLGGSPVTNNPGSLKPDSKDPETETGNLETEKKGHGIQGTLPLQGGPADFPKMCPVFS